MSTISSSGDLSQYGARPIGGIAASRRQGVSRLLPGTVRGLLLLLLLVVLIPGLAYQAADHYFSLEARRSQEFQANLEVARSVAVIFDDFVQDVLHQEMAIGAAVTSQRSLPIEQIHSLLAASAREYPSIDSLNWMDTGGRVIASSVTENVGLDMDDGLFMRDLVSGQQWVVSDLFEAKGTGRATFVIARGVRDELGALRGIASAFVEPGRLYEVLGVERVGQGAIVIIDGKGRGVYRYPAIEMTWEQRNWIGVIPVIARALAGEEVTGTIVALVGNSRLMAAYTPIRSIGWVASASRTEREVMGPMLQDILRDFASMLLVAALALVVALLIGRRLTAPLSLLRGHALAIGGGELDRRVEIVGPGELEQLAAAFNRMAQEIQVREEQRDRAEDALRKAHDELGTRVHQRTTELSDANVELQIEIAERKRAEVALRQSEERYRTLVETSPDAIALTDLDTKIIMCNRETAILVGCESVDDVLGKRALEFIVEDDHQRVMESIAGTLEHGVVKSLEHTMRRKDGSCFPADINGSLLVDADGKPQGFIAIIRDVTERKRAEESLKQGFQRLQCG